MVQAEKLIMMDYIGAGANGAVSRGFTRAFHNVVIKKGTRNLMSKEVEMLEHLHHSNVVALYAEGATNEQEGYLVLQRLGRSLYHLQLEEGAQ